MGSNAVSRRLSRSLSFCVCVFVRDEMICINVDIQNVFGVSIWLFDSPLLLLTTLLRSLRFFSPLMKGFKIDDKKGKEAPLSPSQYNFTQV